MASGPMSSIFSVIVGLGIALWVVGIFSDNGHAVVPETRDLKSFFCARCGLRLVFSVKSGQHICLLCRMPLWRQTRKTARYRRLLAILQGPSLIGIPGFKLVADLVLWVVVCIMVLVAMALTTRFTR